MEKKTNTEMANHYFINQMKKVFVMRVEHKVTETFEEYLSHRYRNSCYYYSAYAIMGMQSGDKMVRGEIRLPDGDWMWCDGGYGHGWVEFTYEGEEFIFDSRCMEIVRKSEWYEKFKPEKMVKLTQSEILDTIFRAGEAILTEEGYYRVKDLSREEDPEYKVKPFTKAKIYMNGNKIEKFIGYRKLLG